MSRRICCAHCLREGELAYEGVRGPVCGRCADEEADAEWMRCGVEGCKALSTCIGPANEHLCAHHCDHADCEPEPTPEDAHVHAW